MKHEEILKRMIEGSKKYAGYSVANIAKSITEINGSEWYIVGLISDATHKVSNHSILYAEDWDAFHKTVVDCAINLLTRHNDPRANLKDYSCYYFVCKVLLNCISSNDLLNLFWVAFENTVVKIENLSLISNFDSMVERMEREDDLQDFITDFVVLLRETNMSSEFFRRFTDLITEVNKEQEFLSVAIKNISLFNNGTWFIKVYINNVFNDIPVDCYLAELK